MSWLSTSLSENLTNITGQISTFTKDMLTEGTVEVDDHEAELKIAKARVRELELTLYTQREEYDRIKELNHELQEKAEAAELQISSISREYRMLLQEKESEVVKLREELDAWNERGPKQDRERLPSFNEDSFVNSTSQDELQYLKAVVNKLQQEKQQWSKNNESENLHKELDHYQHELATLHTTYSQRIATLNKKHKQEIEELESFHHEDSLRIQELEEQLAELEGITVESQNVLEELPESESDFEIIKKESAECDLQALPNDPGTSSEDVSELKVVIDRLECENQHLKEQLNTLEVTAMEKESTIAHLQQENEKLMKQLNQALDPEDQVPAMNDNTSEISHLQQENNRLSEQVNQALNIEMQSKDYEMAELKQEIKNLTEQRDQAVVSEAQTSASLESLREELSRLGAVTMELMKEVEQSQGVDKEKSIEIESLKKLCQVRRVSEVEGDPAEVLKLKDMLAVLWQKYSSVVLENEKVRLDVFNIKRRLLNQLQDRHDDAKSVLDGVSDARTKLTNQIEGQRQEVNMEKHQLISMIPEVENEVENHEDSVCQLVQENNENKVSTKDIVNDFGRRWSVGNHVASLQAEKAVLERTIVGLEEKVQELEEIVRNEREDTPRSSVSTVISVGSLRATPRLSEEDRMLTPEPANGEVLTLENEQNEEATAGLDEGRRNNSNEHSSEESKDFHELLEKLREYEEMIEEFELIKEDWEGEKEALESVVIQLRQKIKDVEKEVGGKRIEKRYLNNVEELLLKKNYVSEEDLKVSDDHSTREDVVLSYVLKWLRNELKEENNDNSSSQKVSEPDILKQDNNQYYTSMTPEGGDFVDELKSPGYSRALSEQMDDPHLGEESTENELHSIRNELEATQNEYSETKHELDETNTRLNAVTNELDKTRLDSEKSRVELREAEEKVTDLESKLKLLKNELEESQVHLNTTISEKENEIHKLRSVVEQLQGTLSNFENDKANVVSELQREVERLQNKLVNATSSCETITTHLDQSKQELAMVLAARDSLAVKLSETGKEKEQLLGMVNDRDVRIEELQDLYDSADQKISLLQDEEKEKRKAFAELGEENSLLKDEKLDLFDLLETKECDLNNSLRESEKLSELLREQELASDEMRRQNAELAKDLENWRIQLEELNQTKELLNRDLDAKSEEIMSLKENNIELANQSYENNEEISQKLSMLEQLVSENMALKSENETLMEALSEKKVSEKEIKDSYNSLLQEKEQLDVTFSGKSLEMDQEIRRKIDEVEILRLEVARLTKESHEKDNTIRAQVSANLVSSSDDDVMAKQEHIRHILAEKDVEIDALRTKNESLLTLFAENEQEKGMVNEEHDKQIASILEREERMFNEINDKNDQIIALEDRLEMLNIKSASKDQASALIHAEHQKLLHLNESQSDEIGRLREKVTGLGLLVADRDHSSSGELQKLRQRNSDLQLQVEALQGEQERLLMLVHDKDKQLLIQELPLGRTEQVLVNSVPSKDSRLLNAVQEEPIAQTEELFVDAPPSNDANLSHNEDEIRKLTDENEKLAEKLVALQNKVVLLTDSIETERKTNTSLAGENQLITQRLNSLEATQAESNGKLKRLEANEERLRQELSVKEREILAGKEENNKQVYEINTLRNEKDELFLEQRSKTEELQIKLSSLLDVICSDVELKDEQFEILENREDFEKLVSRVKTHRTRLLSDKENEVRLLKEQVETLNSVQNITNPQLEAKLEQFLHEKDLLNQKLTDIENEKMELLEIKENEMISLQTQVVDLSNILKQKERQWSTEKVAFSERNNLLEKHAQIVEQERDSLNAKKVETEHEISRLREEVMTLNASADHKLDVVSHEKDRRMKDLERELDDLKQRHSRSLQEAQNMKSEMETVRKVAQEFETKKEKELERLRTHLLQVEDSYTQEALAAEERENDLRNQLEQIQEQLLTSSHSLQDSNRTASMKMENLQEQLINITAHRDEIQAQLEQAQEQTLQHIRSVENLQMVLEQFQREKESELKNLRENTREKLGEAQREITRLHERDQELQQLLRNASDALNKAEKLREDLKSKEEEIESLKVTVSNLESDLQSSHDKLRKLTNNSDGRIEKGLMKNMLLAYFNTSEQKRCEVVALLGHILNFTEEEIKRVGTGSHPPQATGWFSGLLSYSASSQSQQQHDKTFSELFVNFLEKESESQLVSESASQPPQIQSSGRRDTTTVTAIPSRLRHSPLPISPLASSTPIGNEGPAAPVSTPVATNPMMMNVGGMESGPRGSPRIGSADTGNALLGSSLRPSLDLPTITNSSSSSTALRQILFNN